MLYIAISVFTYYLTVTSNSFQVQFERAGSKEDHLGPRRRFQHNSERLQQSGDKGNREHRHKRKISQRSKSILSSMRFERDLRQLQRASGQHPLRVQRKPGKVRV